MLPLEYIKWVESPENGLVKETQLSGIKCKALYRPETYMILNDLGPHHLSDELVKEKKQQYNGLQYYEVIIKMDSTDFIKRNSTDKEVYMSNLYYFTFGFQKDISLIYPGEDTLKVALFHFERSYSLSDSKKFLISFEEKQIKGDRVLRIDSPQLPTGVINLYFEGKSIEKANTVELKKI